MKNIGFLTTIIIIVVSCNDTDSTSALKLKRKVDTVSQSSPALQDQESLAKLEMDSSQDIHSLIKKFSETDFKENRKQLIEEGRENHYQISDVKKIGEILKYEVVIPGIVGKAEYTCNPAKGEFMIIMVGDKEVASLYYERSKISVKWDNCKKSSHGEQCDTYQDWKEYPLKTHFSNAIVNQVGGVSVYTFKRIIMPQ